MQNNLQTVKFGFGGGADTKTDPWQVPAGKFLAIENMIYSKTGALVKRSGLPSTTIPAVTGNNQVATIGNGLASLGQTFQTYSPALNAWQAQPSFTPASIAVNPLVRNSQSQSAADTVIAANGLQCTVYCNASFVGGEAFYADVSYQIVDSNTGQIVVDPTVIYASGINQYARVFLLGSFFVILYQNSLGGLSYLAIQTANPVATATGGFATNSPQVLDGIVIGSTLYVAYPSASGGELIINTLSSSLSVGTPTTIATSTGGPSDASLYLDAGGTNIWCAYILLVSSGTTSTLYSALLTPSLTTLATSSGSLVNSAAINAVAVTNVSISPNRSQSFLTYITESGYVQSPFFTETYVYTGAAITQSGVSIITRGLTIASKAFVYNGNGYVFAVNISTNQPTYFLINQNGLVVSRFAYLNAGTQGQLITQSALLKSGVQLNGSIATFPYLYVDIVTATNLGTFGNSLYGQGNVNFLTMNLSPNTLPTAQGAGNLNIGSGFTWSWDGANLVEQNFLLYPDVVTAVTTTGSSVPAGTYQYQAVYSWIDSQGTTYNSAPLVLGSPADIEITVSTLRQTYKTGIHGPVFIDIYRWSVAQPVFYLVTSQVNDPTVDSISYKDVSTDAQILGNEILYTTGGVVDDFGPPAFTTFASYDSRIWGILAEDPNTLWFSKSLIEDTPVEFSELLTYYVPPVIGTGGNTGPLYAAAPMDDKFILFKSNSIYYIVGSGPDNTGANSQYSAPTTIASSVGTTNPNSLVLTPNGIMFQSNKGIWLLGRDLSTDYIGAPVEQFNSYVITSAQVIPNSTRVKFTTNQPGFILVYDYLYEQWSWDTGITANTIYSSCLYQGLLTLMDNAGVCYQESPGLYVDGASTPVEMSFISGWIALSGLQGYQRTHWFISLARYLSAHSITWSMAYDYQDTAYDSVTVTPNTNTVEQERIFLKVQKCQALQIQMQENLTTAGAGFSMSGINIICMAKGGWRPMPAAQTVGAP